MLMKKYSINLIILTLLLCFSFFMLFVGRCEYQQEPGGFRERDIRTRRERLNRK